LDLVLSSRPQEALALLRERCPGGELLVYGREDWNAPLASGSNPPQAMAICPCSAGTLAAVAAGFANNLIHRAAGVMLKERRKLILVLRETPLSTIHLENMLRLSQAGAVLLPANPGFYHRPASVEQVIDFVVARVLDQLDVPQQLITPWGEERLSDD
jgi:4-hydroxy-3-polyprenylbenzoate decarboxylase